MAQQRALQPVALEHLRGVKLVAAQRGNRVAFVIKAESPQRGLAVGKHCIPSAQLS